MSASKTKNDVSRRQFTKGALASGVGAYAIATGAFHVGKAKADTPQKGGTVRFAMESSSPNDTLDPIGVTSNIDATRCFQLYNNLVRMGNDLRPEPSLAESWEADDSATDWTLDRKSTRLNSSHSQQSRMPSSA